MMPSLRLPLLAAGLAAALSLSPLAFAQDQPAGPTTELSAVPKGKYTVDLGHTNVLFKVSHLGFSTFIGRFNSISGELDFNPKKPERSKLNATIDPASADTKVEKLDAHLKTEDFFNVAKYPQITFKSTKVEKLTDTTGTVTGDLTMLGVTKPVTFDVTFHGFGVHPFTKAPVLGFAAKTVVKRSEFGMTKMVPAVGDEVTIVIQSEFNKPAPVEKKP